MFPFVVTIPATVPQRSEIPEGLTNYPVFSEFPYVRFCNLKFVECRKLFFLLKIFILAPSFPPLGLCCLWRPHHSPSVLATVKTCKNLVTFRRNVITVGHTTCRYISQTSIHAHIIEKGVKKYNFHLRTQRKSHDASRCIVCVSRRHGFLLWYT
jgi:hypothetical protein